jgi:hypothetical protein
MRRLRATTRAATIEAIGFGVAWFAFGAAGIVSLSRLSYFHQYPEQIYANRYLPWPCLFWLGLGLIALGKGGARRHLARVTFVFVALLPLLGWPVHAGGKIYAMLVRGQIDNTAAGTVVGVLERGAPLGDTIEPELIPGISVLRPLRLAQFASPVIGLMGQPLPTQFHPVATQSLELRPIADNLLGEPGVAVVARLPGADLVPVNQLLLVNANNIVVGIVLPDARLNPAGYSGYARGALSQSELRAAEAP